MSETFEAEFLPLGRFTKYERLPCDGTHGFEMNSLHGRYRELKPCIGSANLEHMDERSVCSMSVKLRGS